MVQAQELKLQQVLERLGGGEVSWFRLRLVGNTLCACAHTVHVCQCSSVYMSVCVHTCEADVHRRGG